MVTPPQDRSLRVILHPLIALPVAGILLFAFGAGLLDLVRVPLQGPLGDVVPRLAFILVLPTCLIAATWLLISSVLTRRGEKSSAITALLSLAIVVISTGFFGSAIAASVGPGTAAWVMWVAQNAGVLALATALVGGFGWLYLRQHLLERANLRGRKSRRKRPKVEAVYRQAEDHRQEFQPGESNQPQTRWTPRAAVERDGPTWDEVILPAATKYALLTAQRLLQEAESFRQQFNAEPPRGIILYGPPGTGKTMIARTLATSAGYTFLTASPAELNQMYTGQSEKVIAQLYQRARWSAPCVVFLDEVDAIASPRSAGPDPGGGGRGRNSLLNQLLQELDGFNQSSEMVFTIAATNLLDNLDPAFKSRFGSQIEIGLPDDAARLALFKLYTQGYQNRLVYPLGRLVIRSKGMGGRDITNVCRQAALYTFGTGRLLVGYFAFAYAFEQLNRNLASAVVQKAVAESWANEQLTEAESLERAKAHFATLLTEQFKAEGKTLETQTKSVAERLNEGLVGALLIIAGLKTLKNSTAFIEDCRELEEELYLILSEPSEKN